VRRPSTDQASTKKRPAVVSSSDVCHREHSAAIVMAISSQPRPGAKAETAIHHWQRAGLLDPSVIKPVIATLATSLTIKKLGHLADADRASPQHILSVAPGCDRPAE
jgi:mRNA interferase MazF